MARKEVMKKLAIYIAPLGTQARSQHIGTVRKLCRKVLISVFMLCGSFAQYGLGQEVSGEGTRAVSSSGSLSSSISVLIILFVFLLWSLLPLIICSRVAGRKGKSRGLWMLLAIIFGWIAVLFIAVSATEK
ncbi:hypothetical protein KAH43_03595 [Candidatus Bipolaricaulota bacterium]|nr:hypothetical protein [Candidatus Bipolaricaulota bacterium]